MTGGYGFGPDHRLKTAATLSTLWDGGGLHCTRSVDGIADLRGRRLALHLMVQPDAAADFLSDPVLRDQGLLVSRARGRSGFNCGSSSLSRPQARR
jgi:hypothetical protein